MRAHQAGRTQSALAFVLLASCAVAHASHTLRVGNQVLSAGDSEERAIELLGKPSSRSHARSASSNTGRSGRSRRTAGGQSVERLHFRQDGHYVTVDLIDGRVSEIEERNR